MQLMLKQVKLNPDTAVILKPEILAKTKVLSAPETVVLFQLEIVCVFSHVCHRRRRGLMLGIGGCLMAVFPENYPKTLRPQSEGLLGLASKNKRCLMDFR